MNYRHIYHAGNVSDIIKHLILLQIIEHLKQKEAPFFVLDAHAGVGLYDLTSEEAHKTHEAEAGIGKLLQSLSPHLPLHPVLEKYIHIIKSFNPSLPQLKHYPGSPAFISYLIRTQDRFLANELHPEDYLALRKTVSMLPHPIKTLHMDAYAALKANLPPKEKRGVVLIDPPFEDKDEFVSLVPHLKQALKRWHNGTYMIWFPLKLHLPIHQFYQEIAALNVPKTWLLESWVQPASTPDTLNGCGIIIMNTPWELDTKFMHYSKVLQNTLLPKAAPGFKTRWLVA
jgi:23S rRNA (adenine2030-N6)-methyltransferase